MTTGSTTVGNRNSSFFYKKTWSGTNGTPIWKTIPARISVELVPERRYYTVFPPRLHGRPERVYYNTTRLIRHVVPAKRVRTGVDCHTWHSYTCTVERLKQQVAPGGYGGLGYFSGVPLSGVLPANDRVRLQNRLLRKIRGHSFNIAVSNAQDAKTLEMVTGTVVRLAKVIRALKRGNVTLAARTLGLNSFTGANRGRQVLESTQVASDIWLEMQYGWKPLLNDVHDAAEALAYSMDPPRRSRLVVVGKKSYDAKTVNYTTDFRTTESLDVSERIICDLVESLSAPRSLGLTDPASVAWELLPWSFVADWFIPIGTYLDNFNAIPNLQASYLQTDYSVFRGKARYDASLPHPPYGDPRIFCDAEYVSMTRAVLTSLPVVRPEFSLPSSNTGRFWNALALLRQLF